MPKTSSCAILDPSALTGSLQLGSNAVIRGGEIEDSAVGGALVWQPNAGVEFDGVQRLNADLTIASGGELRMRSGGDLVLGDTRTLTMGTGSANAFSRSAGAACRANRSARRRGAARRCCSTHGTSTSFIGQSSGATVTVSPGVTLTGTGNGSFNTNSPVNQGVIEPTGSGRTWTLSPTTFTNSGVLGVKNGATISRPGGFTNPLGGEIRGNGTISVGDYLVYAGLILWIIWPLRNDTRSRLPRLQGHADVIQRRNTAPPAPGDAG